MGIRRWCNSLARWSYILKPLDIIQTLQEKGVVLSCLKNVVFHFLLVNKKYATKVTIVISFFSSTIITIFLHCWEHSLGNDNQKWLYIL